MLELSLKDQDFTPMFGGNLLLPENERIVVSVRELTVGDIFVVQKKTDLNLFTGFQIELSPDKMEEYWDLMRALLVPYTSNWRGIKLEGELITESEAVLNVLKLTHWQLIAEVFQHVMTISTKNEEDAKNFEAESVPENMDSALIAENVEPADSKPLEIAVASS